MLLQPSNEKSFIRVMQVYLLLCKNIVIKFMQSALIKVERAHNWPNWLRIVFPVSAPETLGIPFGNVGRRRDGGEKESWTRRQGEGQGEERSLIGFK
jgi:hypothetical protein